MLSQRECHSSRRLMTRLCVREPGSVFLRKPYFVQVKHMNIKRPFTCDPQEGGIAFDIYFRIGDTDTNRLFNLVFYRNIKVPPQGAKTSKSDSMSSFFSDFGKEEGQSREKQVASSLISKQAISFRPSHMISNSIIRLMSNGACPSLSLASISIFL